MRFVLKQEKTPEFDSVCDKAEIGAFVWLPSYLFVTIRLFLTFFLKSMTHHKRIF